MIDLHFERGGDLSGPRVRSPRRRASSAWCSAARPPVAPEERPTPCTVFDGGHLFFALDPAAWPVITAFLRG